MSRIPTWFHRAFTDSPNVPALFSYPFLLVLLVLVYFQVILQAHFPEHTSGTLPGFFVVAMLILNHLAYSFSWGSARIRAALRIGAWAWIVFVYIFLATHQAA